MYIPEQRGIGTFNLKRLNSCAYKLKN
uniref:Uncharacterized protein n=1 Tax=Rhizophora mucronata TaxID=61149 RepID=A0A2P2JZ73_RHIMU